MKSKRIVWILVSVVVLLLVVAIFTKGGANNAIKVTAEKPEYRTVIETVSASGKIQPEVEVIISSDVSGEIIEMAVKEGDFVKQGDLLLKINPDLVESALGRAEAAVNTAKANYSSSQARLAQSKAQFVNAQASFDRNKKLYKDQVISDAEFDNATSSFEVAKAEVTAAQQSVQAALYNIKSAEASLKEARENLGRTSIYAPMNGTIINLSKEKGERVVGTAQMAGTEILTVADLTTMEVDVDVNENDIVRVSKNDTVLIEVDAYLERKFKGVVTEIANSANTTGASIDQVTNFDVKIRILQESYKDLMDRVDSASSPFRPGMSANVDIQTKRLENVLSLPIQAVTTRADTSDTKEETDDERLIECVFVLSEGKAVLKKVVTGIQDTKYIQIETEIDQEVEVITGPYTAVSKLLEDGSAVNKVKKEMLFEREE
jgi:HlyD family secretion protein